MNLKSREPTQFPIMIPCQARHQELPSHTPKTAYFLLKSMPEHGSTLICSHLKCRELSVKKSKFCWCKVCGNPYAKRNFKIRHSHTKEIHNKNRNALGEIRCTKKSGVEVTDLPGLSKTRKNTKQTNKKYELLRNPKQKNTTRWEEQRGTLLEAGRQQDGRGVGYGLPLSSFIPGYSEFGQVLGNDSTNGNYYYPLRPNVTFGLHSTTTPDGKECQPNMGLSLVSSEASSVEGDGHNSQNCQSLQGFEEDAMGEFNIDSSCLKKISMEELNYTMAGEFPTSFRFWDL